jgi:Amt family ammonium transporter
VPKQSGNGVFYGGGLKLLGTQTLGVVSVCAYVAVVMTIVFLVCKYTVGLRAPLKDELDGLDVSEHGLLTAYAGFAMMPDTIGENIDTPVVVAGDIPVAEAIPVKKVPSFEEGTQKFTKVQIIFKEDKFESLKKALVDIGITGMTLSHVMGCGLQKGHPEFYRGVEVEPTLLPKVQLDVVVSKVPVRRVIETAKKVLYTGNIGDGKIFVYDVENVVKVRAMMLYKTSNSHLSRHKIIYCFYRRLCAQLLANTNHHFSVLFGIINLKAFESGQVTLPIT